MKKKEPIFSEQEQRDLKNAFDLYYRSIAHSLPEEALQETTFSPKLEFKMKKIFKKSSTRWFSSPILKNAAAFLLLFCLSAAVLLSSLQIFSILKEQQTKPDGSLSSSLDKNDHTPFYYLPKGLKYKKDISQTSYGTVYYTGRGGKWLNVTNYTSNFPEDYYPKDENFLILNHFPASYATNEKNGLIIVHLENSVYVIEGSYGKAELLRVAESICAALQ